jgi:hypothetical protein
MVMAAETATDQTGGEDAVPVGKVFSFPDVFREEISLINRRRAEDPRGEIKCEIECEADTSGEQVLRPAEEATVVGLALSGGGIRSAAFGLGALQALHEAGVLDRVEYLSTVSGGGYIGCSLTAGLESTGGAFPFTSRLAQDETPSVQHIRDFSNYLFPEGAIDLLHNASIYVRGLATNAVLIAPFLLLAAAITIAFHSTPESLRTPNFLGLPIPNVFDTDRFHFVVTSYLSMVLLVVTIAWGLFRSMKNQQNSSEVPNRFTKYVGSFVLVVLLSAFGELQPFVLDGIFRTQEGGFFAGLSAYVNALSVALAPVAAVVAFLGNKVGEFVKSAAESSSMRTQIAGSAAKGVIYLAAIVVPLLLWAVYLNITYWGLCLNVQYCSAPTWLSGLVAPFRSLSEHPSVWLYLVLAGLLAPLSLLLRPNANSLHPLYRDRLGKAFLFEPQDKLPKDAELQPLRRSLSQLSGCHGPYPLINAALNIQSSKTANKRGRNADFFVFSPKFVGSKSTGYVKTADMETVATGLDLATAMAVSGAAASSNMGAESIKPLTPTLAILNIRLGYWLRNPLRVAKGGARNILANFYIIAEALGQLNESRKSVYLTDGGHIENLGIYELLRRRCRIIIAIDAEADAEMAFGSLITLERYARIDLGIGIDLPWEQISDVSRATGAAIDEHGECPKQNGPHCAIGQIKYPSGHKGILIYIKSSLTGDENDYVFHYKKRYSSFPHETTLDQWFSEEQFEAYRALGFHATHGLFDRRDAFAHLDLAKYPQVRQQVALLDQCFPHAGAGGTSRQRRTFVALLRGAKPARSPKPGKSAKSAGPEQPERPAEPGGAAQI